MLQLSGSHHNLDMDLLIYVNVACFNGQINDKGNKSFKIRLSIYYIYNATTNKMDEIFHLFLINIFSSFHSFKIYLNYQMLIIRCLFNYLAFTSTIYALNNVTLCDTSSHNDDQKIN